MNLARSLFLAALLAAAPAWGQQPKTTEQQARSYILSAFMTGAAPAVFSDDVRVAAGLRERLALPAQADSRAVYNALAGLTSGKSLTVRAASGEEMSRADAQAAAGRPVFALDAGDSTFVLQYDLDRDAVTYVADSTQPVAVPSPVTAPAPPERMAEPEPAVAAAPSAPAPEPPPAPAPEPPAASPPPAPALQVVEPREPRFTAAPAAAARRPPAMQESRAEPRRESLRPSGPCVIKPVMSDRDLVNCGATPR